MKAPEKLYSKNRIQFAFERHLKVIAQLEETTNPSLPADVRKFCDTQINSHSEKETVRLSFYWVLYAIAFQIRLDLIIDKFIKDQLAGLKTQREKEQFIIDLEHNPELQSLCLNKISEGARVLMTTGTTRKKILQITQPAGLSFPPTGKSILRSVSPRQK